MREITKFLTQYFWEDAYETLLGSTIVFLISLFFANFDRIFPLYDPLITEVPNANFGVISLFKIVVWPALLSLTASMVFSLIKIWQKIRGRRNNAENEGRPSA